MKARFSRLPRLLSLLGLITWATVPRAASQTPPQLGIQILAGLPTLSLTGSAETVYSIQYADGLSQTNVWTDRTLVQAKVAPIFWTDPTPLGSGCRLYRAVSVPAPADPNLVFIQPGTFTMGSPTNEVDRYDWEGPQTAVTISRGFWMGKFEVTQGEYLAVKGNNPSWFNGVNGEIDHGIDLNRPVEMVSWSDATNYCAMLTQREWAAGRIPSHCVYRLPTEAEWEYACRAGTSTRFSYGDDNGYVTLGNYAWYDVNNAAVTQPVGKKLPNLWGLYDMHGNVFELCQDSWSDNLPGGIALDPQERRMSTFRVIRGGSRVTSYLQARNCRSAARFIIQLTWSWEDTGLRVVLAPAQP